MGCVCLFSIGRPSGVLGQQPRYLMTESSRMWETFWRLVLLLSFYIWVVLSLLFPNHILVRASSTLVEYVISWFSFYQLLKYLVPVGAETGARRK